MTTAHELNLAEGLSQKEALRLLQKIGPNKLPEAKVDGTLKIFFRQFTSPLIFILFAASATVFFMGEIIDGSIILAILFFNAIVGSIQEGKAQNTLLALKNFVETKATVVRDGRQMVLGDKELVPGDLIVLREGERVPADARLLSSNSLKVDEASLTGESEPVHKKAEEEVFKGTHVVLGNARAVVTATGLKTAIGKIAKEIASIDSAIPLKENIHYLSKLIIGAVGGISIFLFLLGIVLGEPVREMFTIVVSLAVSVIPEGLPIVMTLVLATGVWRMSKHNVLVKKLQAVEALGQTRLFAVDKTGTITKNELVIQKVWLKGKVFEIGGVGYESKGTIKFDGNTVDPTNHTDLLWSGKVAALSGNAEVLTKESGEFSIAGDPTEAAMLIFSKKVGFHKKELILESPLIDEIPFDYKLQYHASLHKDGDDNLLLATGAPETILNLCNLEEKEKDEIMQALALFSKEGLRVLAFASKKEKGTKIGPKDIHTLSFGGLFGMRDALRAGVKEAIAKASLAGIKVVMITGDYKVTACAIAREAGIYKEGDKVLTGKEIDLLSDQELQLELPRVTVFSRVTPEHKLRIINNYKKLNQVVAMTGDGVNDAPSLVAADLGVAMGRIGTEVAKEASDIILLDDNFGNIIFAIEEGRNIYKTIKKVILYLFSTSLGEVLTISGALMVGFPVPILAVQVIWLNFVTDGFLDVALAMEPKEKGLLSGKFEKPKRYIVDDLMLKRMFLMAIPMMVGTIILFSFYFDRDLKKAWTIALTLLAIFQWFNAWNCRSETKSIFKMNPFSNKYLVGATLVVILLQLFAVYNPLMQGLLHTSPLTLCEWLIIIPIAFSIVFVEEIRKLLVYRSTPPAQI